MTVDELLRRIQCSESQEDWTEFVRRTHPFIMSICLSTCKYAPSDRDGTIEAAVQQTYIKILACLRKSRSYRWIGLIRRHFLKRKFRMCII